MTSDGLGVVVVTGVTLHRKYVEGAVESLRWLTMILQETALNLAAPPRLLPQQRRASCPKILEVAMGSGRHEVGYIGFRCFVLLDLTTNGISLP